MIKGVVNAFPSDDRVENMEVGQQGYVDAYDVIVTRKKIFLDRLTPVLLFENDTEEEDSDVIIIERVGPGMTENDFVLDFTKCTERLEIEGNAVVIRLEKEKDMYIVFSDLILEISQAEHAEVVMLESDYSKLSLPELKELLQTATAPGQEDYEEAIKLRDHIREREKQKELSKKSHKNK